MVLELAKSLIAKPSITPLDAGCQTIIADYLSKLGFHITEYSSNGVKNLWAVYGNPGPLFVFAGHTDVVPPGPPDLWASDPFKPVVRDGFLYGRGAADMKSSIAAMLVACHDFLKDKPQFIGRIGFLITGDEEGPAIDGTRKVVEKLKEANYIIDYCLIGEASSEYYFGDTIKVGRRGSLSARLTIHGKQGHIAYPHLANNPIHAATPFLFELISCIWDQGNDYFQPTQLQVSNIHAGTGVTNVIPPDLVMDFNFRYSPEQSIPQLQHTVKSLLSDYECRYSIEWNHSGEPFFCAPSDFARTAQEVIHEVTGQIPKFSTSGGTSDGRFLRSICREMIEFGPINESIHKIDENIKIEDLQKLKLIYQKLLHKLFENV